MAMMQQAILMEEQRTYKNIHNRLNTVTHGGYVEKNRDYACRKNHIEYTDWRVPRLVYCKDPKWNAEADPRFAQEVLMEKERTAQDLESRFAKEAYDGWARALESSGRVPPPAEVIKKPGASFTEVNPAYRREDDVWERQVHLRALKEAMEGDISHELPRPVIFPDSYENCKGGKYIKDDCLIA